MRQESIRETIQKHEKANVNHLVQGVHIIELAKKVYRLCRARQLTKKGKLLRILLSHCTFDSEKLYPTHNGLFDLLVKSKENDDWLPGLGDVDNKLRCPRSCIEWVRGRDHVRFMLESVEEEMQITVYGLPA